MLEILWYILMVLVAIAVFLTCRRIIKTSCEMFESDKDADTTDVAKDSKD